MKSSQIFVVFVLVTFSVWSGYYAVLSWTNGPEWRIIASTAALVGFLTLTALYVHFLLTDNNRN